VLSKIFEALYNKVFISIVVERSKSIVYVEECSGKEILNTQSESFATTELSDKMYEYIETFISQTPFHYISILDTSNEQGAIPTCSSKDMSLFYDPSLSKHICHQNRWAYYTLKSNIDIIKYNYAKIGIDFIFSPFTILSNFFKDKIDSNLAIYILLEDNYVSIAIFDNSELLYADYMDMQHGSDSEELMIDESSDDEADLDLEGSIDLEDIDAMSDIDGLDDFGDIEDLDAIDEIDEFAESQEEDKKVLEDENLSMDDVSGFNEDYQRFSLIQSSINNFYKDRKYNSKFVESAYIADAIGVSGDLKKYLEEEMFLSVFVRHIDLGVEVCEMAKADLK
jgi:hypothetical protein